MSRAQAICVIMRSGGSSPIMATQSETLFPMEPENEHKALRVVGWFSAGIAVAGLGLLLGYELRSRYKFNHRTPYDFFSHAEPVEPAADEFGVGI